MRPKGSGAGPGIVLEGSWQIGKPALCDQMEGEAGGQIALLNGL